MKKWHWIILGLLTLASIVAGLTDTHGHHATSPHGNHASSIDNNNHHSNNESVNHSATENEGGHGLNIFGAFKWILFGAIGCALLIFFAKIVLGPVIYKKEDYYNE